MKLIHRFARRCLADLAPAVCSLCGLPSQRSIALCATCEATLPRNLKACNQCGLPLAGANLVCGHCQLHPSSHRVTVAPCLYAKPVDGLIQALKYRGDFSQVAVLSHLMVDSVAERLSGSDAPSYLVPMPLHWWRQWRRGFNQAELLARALCRQPGLLPWSLRVDHRLCRRRRATRPQAQLDARQRLQNLRGAMVCRRRLEGLRVAIVDDVVTTGASAYALAAVLQSAGAEEVEIWCCARTPRPALASAIAP